MHLSNLSQLYKFMAEFINKVSYHCLQFIFRPVFLLSMMEHLKIMVNFIALTIICFNH